MIRNAILDDVDAVVAIGERFHAESNWGAVCEYVADDEARTCAHLVTSDDGLLIVADNDGEIVGALGGLFFPAHMNFAHRMGQELFWFVLPEYRGGLGAMLLQAAEEAARAAGCKHWGMGAIEHLRGASVQRLLERDGYRATERCFMKEL